MSDYDGLISAGNVALRPDFLAEIFSATAEQSAVLRLGTKLRNMTTSELTFKVSTALPSVYFVGTKGTSQTFPSSALKKVTTSEWEDVSLYAGELAAIIVVPNNVFNDSHFNIESELRRQLPAAIGKKVDEAVLFGTHAVDVPDNWSDGIYQGMPADNMVQDDLGADLYDAILGAAGLFAQVELDGYDVNGIVSDVSMKSQLRGLRDVTSGQPLFVGTMQEGPVYSLAGVTMTFPKNGSLDATKALMIAGDWSKLVYSIREDVRFDVFTTGVIQEANGDISHNLMQEDLTAIRCTFRMGWALPQPEDMTTVSGVKYPFAALIPWDK